MATKGAQAATKKKAAPAKTEGTGRGPMKQLRAAADGLLARDWESARKAFLALVRTEKSEEEQARIFELVKTRADRLSDRNESNVVELLLLGAVRLQDAAAGHVAFDRLIELEPKAASLRYRKALLHYRTNEAAAAAALWEDLRGSYEPKRDLDKMLAQALVVSGERKKAIAVLHEAIAENPRDHELYGILAKAFMVEKDYAAASEAFRKALLRNSKERDYFSGLIACYGKRDMMKPAEQTATLFVRRFPSYIAPSSLPGLRVLLLEHTSRMLLTDGRYGRKSYAVNNMVSMMSDGRVAFNHLYVDLSRDPVSEALKIPPCEVVFNNAANAELLLANKSSMLRRTLAVCNALNLPVINPADRVAETTRRRNYERFQNFDGIVFPKTIKLTFDAGREDEVVRRITEAIPFPLILRQSYTHADTETDRVRDEKELRAVLPKYAGKQAYIIEYIDCSDDEGVYRRYRTLFVGDKIFPSSVLASEGWNVHSAASVDLMDRTQRLKEEERRYQTDMESVVGREAVDTFWRIRDEIGLDYFGIDYTFDPEGRIVVFEINPSMNLAVRERGDFGYIEESNAGIKRAMEDLMIRKAESVGIVPKGVRSLFG